MKISKVVIENFKCFKGKFSLELSDDINILVGDNEAGKSTIIEAIHLGLSGLINGRYLKNELTGYLFNNEVVQEYILSLTTDSPQSPPYILIELYFDTDQHPILEGNYNSEKTDGCGILYKIQFDENAQAEYEKMLSEGTLQTIPIEFYNVAWKTFARESITARSIPIKSALIDSSSSRFQNGSDIYISRIIRDNLEKEDRVKLSQSHRRLKEAFMADSAVVAINEKIQTAANISDKTVSISVDLATQNAWETSLLTYLDNVPFQHIGKGEQCVVKTNLALSHNKNEEANILLLEEPENHLSHTKLNTLVKVLKERLSGKQVLISTHSSFVANKLGLDNLILLNNLKTVRLAELQDETERFFEKLSGYDTLRLVLSKKAILVEGDSDELVVQKAYMRQYNGRLPIEDGIDIIAVGTSFLRFLEIARAIEKPTVVVTDSDGNVDGINKKYKDYLGKDAPEYIKICFDSVIDTGTLKISGSTFNYNTLEPKMLKVNSLDKMNTIFGKDFKEIDELHKYMKGHKTECALKIFDTQEQLKFPQYILDAIS